MLTGNTEESKPPRKRKPSTADAASPRKKQKAIQMELDKPHPEPANWQAVYEKIEKMRSQIIAPVDTMGCHTPMLEEGEPRVCFIYFPKNGIYGAIGYEHSRWDRLNASQHWSPSCSAPKPRMRLLPQQSKICAPSSVGILRWMPFWKQRKKILRKPSLRSGFGDERLGEFQFLCFYNVLFNSSPR